MERKDKIKKLSWFHFMILKALVSEQTQSLDTKQIAQKLKSYFDYYGLTYHPIPRRVFFMQKIENLIDLGVVDKIKGVRNIYSLNKKYSKDAMMVVWGYFGIWDKKGVKK